MAKRGILFEWLDRIGLGYAIPMFEARGITTPQSLTSFSADDFDSVGVTSPADRKRLFELVQRVKMASRAIQNPPPSPKPKPVATSTPTKESPPLAEKPPRVPRVEESPGRRYGWGSGDRRPTTGQPQQKLRPPSSRSSGGNSGGEEGGGRLARGLAARRAEAGLHGGGGQGGVSGGGNGRISPVTGSGGSGEPGGGGGAAAAGSGISYRSRPTSAAPSTGGGGSGSDSAFGMARSVDSGDGALPRRGSGSSSGTAGEQRRAVTAVPGGRKAAGDGGSGSSGRRTSMGGYAEHGRGSRAGTGGGGGGGVSSGRYRGGAGGGGGRPRAASESTAASGGGGGGGVSMGHGGGEEPARIRVVVRKRPMSKNERRGKQQDILEPQGQRMCVYAPRTKVDLTKYTERFDFAFDAVFGATSNTETIYRESCQPLIGAVFAGANAACFAYGQTGSGKTFTMMGGGASNPGMYLLAARDIFTLVDSPEYSYLKVYASFFEIYGGQLFDLLNSRRKLRCLEDSKQRAVVVGLKKQLVLDVPELLAAIDVGLTQRSTGSTGANLDSSRSHAILQIALRYETKRATDHSRAHGKAHDPGSTQLRELGRFSFIDLAGSERGADTKHNNRKTRLEGAEINKSLLALKECIRALHLEHDHTPFRGSKLTQVLKDSFVGNSRTVMIATVSPNTKNCEHTLNTLRYAYRVKETTGGGGGGGAPAAASAAAGSGSSAPWQQRLDRAERERDAAAAAAAAAADVEAEAAARQREEEEERERELERQWMLRRQQQEEKRAAEAEAAAAAERARREVEAEAEAEAARAREREKERERELLRLWEEEEAKDKAAEAAAAAAVAQAQTPPPRRIRPPASVVVDLSGREEGGGSGGSSGNSGSGGGENSGDELLGSPLLGSLDRSGESVDNLEESIPELLDTAASTDQPLPRGGSAAGRAETPPPLPPPSPVTILTTAPRGSSSGSGDGAAAAAAAASAGGAMSEGEAAWLHEVREAHRSHIQDMMQIVQQGMSLLDAAGGATDADPSVQPSLSPAQYLQSLDELLARNVQLANRMRRQLHSQEEEEEEEGEEDVDGEGGRGGAGGLA